MDEIETGRRARIVRDVGLKRSSDCIKLKTNMDTRSHWENIYRTKESDQVSWFQTRSSVSLELIESAGLNRDSSIIDVGGGDSVLIDDLLALGFRNLTVLDISAAALERTRARLGERAKPIT